MGDFFCSSSSQIRRCKYFWFGACAGDTPGGAAADSRRGCIRTDVDRNARPRTVADSNDTGDHSSLGLRIGMRAVHCDRTSVGDSERASENADENLD